MRECSKRTAGTVVALTLVAVAAFAVPAGAQNLSLGYQVQRFSSEGDSVNAPFGFSLSVAGSGPLTLVGQVDWSRKHESQVLLGTSVDATANFTAFAGGIRMSGQDRHSASPFVDLLFGAMRSSGSANVAGEKIDGGSETDKMLQLGGGVSVPMSGGLGFFGQLDYRRVFATDAHVNVVRFVAGIRLTAQ
jgi:hypothetical protein